VPNSIVDAFASDVIFNADHSRMYVARHDGFVTIYDTLSGQVIQNIRAGRDLGGMDISPDGSFLLVTENQALSDNGSTAVFAVHKLDLATGTVTNFRYSFGSIHGPFYDVAMFADGTAIVTTTLRGSGTSTTYSLNTRTGVFTALESGSAQAPIVTATADRQHILLSPGFNVSGPLQVYDLVDGGTIQRVAQRNTGSSGESLHAYTFDGSIIAYLERQVGVIIYGKDLAPITTITGLGEVQGMVFDDLAENLYVATGGRILKFSTSSWAQVASFPYPADVPQEMFWAFFRYGASLALGPDSQYLTLVGSDHLYRIENPTAISPIRGTALGEAIGGNDAANVVNGLDGDDTLSGLGGNDRLRGGAGNDLLDGGTGRDVLYGGDGDDIYAVDDSGDQVVELANAGVDEVRASVSFALPLNVERLLLTGTAAIGGTGNALENVLTGSTAANVLTGLAGNDTLSGLAGNDTLDGGAGNDRIDGGAGADTLSYATATEGVTVNLSSTTSQDTGGSGNDTITNLENLVGSAFADVLTGNTGANVIDGGGGEDLINGGIGSAADTLAGGAGIDTVTYASAASRVIVNLGLTSAQNTLGAGIDTLSGFENLIGSAYNDTLTGTAGANRIEGGLGNDALNGLAGNDVLVGGDGNDTLTSGAGDDSIDGGAGTDIANYADATAGVTVSLLVSTAQNTGGAGTDTLTGIEGLLGSAFNDTLIGTTGDNSLSGGLGSDLIRGDLGNDSIDGGSGIDTLDYSLVGAGVTVNLVSQSVQNTGGAGFDRIINIENVIGTAFADVLTGNMFGNVLTGGAGIDTASYANAATGVRVNLTVTTAQSTLGAGSDTLVGIENLTGSAFDDLFTGDAGNNVLTGNAGNDTLIGGLGDDTLSGGAGSDTASYAGATTGITVNLSQTVAQNTIGAGIDTLASIENLIGSALADTLTGNAQLNIITGGNGDDLIDGGSANDTLDGGGNNDMLKGGSGDDLLTGGVGRDLLTGGAGNDRFVYLARTDSAAGANSDRIADFALGDILDLSAIDANANTVGSNDAFVRVTAFTGVAGQFTLAFSGGTTTLLGDTNGDGAGDFSVLFTGDVTAMTGNWVL